MIQDCNTERLAVDGSMVIDPRGLLAPSIFVGIAFVINNMAAIFGLNFHCAGNADAEAAFFRITENYGRVIRHDGHVKVYPTYFFVGSKNKRANIGANLLAIVVNPVVTRDDGGLLTTFGT